jgi:hypothetical protein
MEKLNSLRFGHPKIGRYLVEKEKKITGDKQKSKQTTRKNLREN